MTTFITCVYLLTKRPLCIQKIYFDLFYYKCRKWKPCYLMPLKLTWPFPPRAPIFLYQLCIYLWTGQKFCLQTQHLRHLAPRHQAQRANTNCQELTRRNWSVLESSEAPKLKKRPTFDTNPQRPFFLVISRELCLISCSSRRDVTRKETENSTGKVLVHHAVAL